MDPIVRNIEIGRRPLEAYRSAVTDTAWAPLSRRAADLLAEPLEHIPDWLYPQLVEWLYHVLQCTEEPIKVLRPGHGLTDDTRNIMLRIRSSTQPWLLSADDPVLLDAMDATIRWRPWPAPISPGYSGVRFTFGEPDSLERILAAANFAWRVNADWRGLERRIDPTATAAVTTTIVSAPAESSRHLAAAWDAAYGRAPDPDKAYAEAVKAVEAVACTLVLPTNGNATLGTVRTHLRDAPTKWELVLPGKDGNPGSVTPMVEMLTALWEGQRSRHAGTATSRPQTQAEAEAAVHLAGTLVQWLATGVLRRRTP
ncbi:hypothetical protein [Dactylosporangium sp. CA-233914]|uniref:hypothetical protein n=1 Tax=Dactylosporangium sp. CA-233914 TaxID=3239934 RepID=UPI003D8E6A35